VIIIISRKQTSLVNIRPAVVSVCIFSHASVAVTTPGIEGIDDEAR
jgi:hypothetical protein